MPSRQPVGSLHPEDSGDMAKRLSKEFSDSSASDSAMADRPSDVLETKNMRQRMKYSIAVEPKCLRPQRLTFTIQLVTK